jgi:drug/metabolite transporter (DMT)-like permease
LPAINDERRTRRKYFVGIILLLAAACLWSLNGALIKLIHQGGEGPHAVTIAFYRSLFAGLFLLPLARGKFHTLFIRPHGHASVDHATRPNRGTRNPVRRLLTLRPAAISCVVFFTLMTVCFVLATTKTEAANAIILQYTSTFWIFGLSPLVLGERPGRRDLRVLALAMIGIAIIFAGRMATDLGALLIALTAGLCYALQTLMIRRMRDSDSAAIIVLSTLGSAVLLLPAALLVGHLIVTPRELGLLILMGVVQFGLPYYLYARALTRVPAYHAALITLTEPVLVPVWTYMAVSEKVPLTTVVGGAVILASLALFLGRK